MQDSYRFRVIAHIKTDYKELFGIPRQSGSTKGSLGRIVFSPAFRDPNAIRGIEEFSHLWLVFVFSESVREGFVPMVRPPRLGGNRKVGVFASRAPFRPNPVGLSSVRLVGVEDHPRDGRVLIVEGADLLDGTPILDIKPYLPHADMHADAVGGYADRAYAYALSVDFPSELLLRIAEEKREPLLSLLAEDPRPAYQDDPCRVYGFRYADYEVKFRADGEGLHVVDVLPLSE